MSLAAKKIKSSWIAKVVQVSEVGYLKYLNSRTFSEDCQIFLVALGKTQKNSLYDLSQFNVCYSKDN